VPVPDIMTWVETCVDRLQRAGAQVVLTALPLQVIRTVSPTGFHVVRAVACPRCRLDRPTLLGRVEELDQRLRDLARQRGLTLAETRPEWYGFDLVHIRQRHWPAAWGEILGGWATTAAEPGPGPLSFGEGLRLRLLPVARRWLFGRQYERAQPAGTLPDGSTLALY
jgi:hypothetical protein